MDIERNIERFIVDEIMLGDKNTKLDPDQSLITSGIVDSLALLRLIAFIEEQFSVKVEDEEVIPDNFDTITIMKNFVEQKL
jgi:acyl carrier protein